MALDSVKTKNGSVRGLPCGNPAYTVFKAIPYAKPPVGDLRWKAPQEADAWEGIREAVRFSPASLQPSRSPGEFYAKEFFPVDEPVSEDSLYLNIWTPAETGTEKLPVMFWIHGGAFVQGFGHEMEFDGEAFCRRGVILVTFNYRLGILGFFAHPDLTATDGYSGNYAILDTIAALTWVRNNIAAFGGDRNNVTVFGQSAGGAMVNALVTSPLARGLLHKAILLTGQTLPKPATRTERICPRGRLLPPRSPVPWCSTKRMWNPWIYPVFPILRSWKPPRCNYACP
ncbi:hypothetical protein AGMMS49579_26920 [Spirochaetia bacterium]|nr:hypothetical protein AGMMS49579_26920 [Spirochaetia bacterium]